MLPAGIPRLETRATETVHNATMNALNRALWGAVSAVWLTAAVISPALASKTEKIDELVGLHNLKTAVAIGNYYLKQQTLIAVREELARLGRDQNLGAA